GSQFKLGGNAWEGDGFDGEMDEVRVWQVERTEEQIRKTMSQKLTGQEPDLVGLWSFDSATNSVVKDLSPGGHDALLKGNAIVTRSTQPGPSSVSPGALERVVQLDGANSFVDLGPKGVMLGKHFTEEAWIFPDSNIDDGYHGFLG